MVYSNKLARFFCSLHHIFPEKTVRLTMLYNLGISINRACTIKLFTAVVKTVAQYSKLECFHCLVISNLA